MRALAGVIPADQMEDYLPVRFVPPGWQWVDPRNEVEAETAAINAGLKSRAEVVAARGRDIDELDEEIARDAARARCPSQGSPAMSIHLRAASPRPSTFDPEARTIEAIISTDADVERAGHVERLDLSGADLSRLTGAPVLDAHRSGSTRNQLGVVEAAELRPEGLWVRMKFRSNDAAQAVLADIADGTLRGLSIGYSVRRWSEGSESGRRIRKALQWSPVEVSIVPVPADPGAHFRNGEPTMPETGETTTTTTEAGGETATRAAVNTEIRIIAETAGLTRAWANAQIDAEASVEDARAAAFTEMRQRAAENRRHG